MKNYYEILGLNKNCTVEDIKNSYIKLSKKYHPDCNQSKDAHKKFVLVNEAYSVLSKKNKRLDYDESLNFSTRYNVRNPDYYSSRRADANYYYSMYQENVRRNYETAGANIGLKLKLAFFCCSLFLLGSGLYFRVQKIRADIRNQQLMKYLAESRNQASKLSREEAIKRFAERYQKKNSSNQLEDTLNDTAPTTE